ncbi:MAG: glucosaminidase domain-containing protein [Marinifilaceae bacterium]|jgi:LysM repeat protein|nr:glucosaminidase domain-containing protein [Marinifilaceae bacterium]
MRKLLILAIILISVNTVFAKGFTRHQYIQKYKSLAVKEMYRTGIPASITLAQGLLESGNGNSSLAVKANNHFGIKCHDWTGPSMRFDDDKKNECFRKYNDPYDSYMDHSKFLTGRKRYAFLFNYSSTDYKRWAHGLKKAGYATDPKYAYRLIKIIEDEHLHQYDKKVKPTHKPIHYTSGKTKKPNKLADIDNGYNIDVFGARLEIANGVNYIVIQKGDTYYRLLKEFELTKKKLLKYNDLAPNHVLKPGQRIYVGRKRSRSAKGYDYHRVKSGETMHSISQYYCIKLKRLLKFNGMRKNEKLIKGQKIWLKSR